MYIQFFSLNSSKLKSQRPSAFDLRAKKKLYRVAIRSHSVCEKTKELSIDKEKLQMHTVNTFPGLTELS
jgi:hypothetical protein